jgi:hypothetical protein
MRPGVQVGSLGSRTSLRPMNNASVRDGQVIRSSLCGLAWGRQCGPPAGRGELPRLTTQQTAGAGGLRPGCRAARHERSGTRSAAEGLAWTGSRPAVGSWGAGRSLSAAAGMAQHLPPSERSGVGRRAPGGDVPLLPLPQLCTICRLIHTELFRWPAGRRSAGHPGQKGRTG